MSKGRRKTRTALPRLRNRGHRPGDDNGEGRYQGGLGGEKPPREALAARSQARGGRPRRGRGPSGRGTRPTACPPQPETHTKGKDLTLGEAVAEAVQKGSQRARMAALATVLLCIRHPGTARHEARHLRTRVLDDNAGGSYDVTHRSTARRPSEKENGT